MIGTDELNHRIIFEVKEGCTKENTIIEIGINKAQSLKGYINRLHKQGKPTPNLIEVSLLSRAVFRHGVLS